MKTLALLLFTMIGYLGFSQGDLNDYKYIIVPKKFDSFKSENRYQTSTLIKYLFSQKGFTAIYEDALPEDLLKNRCLGLLTGLIDESSMFSTKTTLVLKDCAGNEVFRTMQGTSRQKEYKPAFKEAIKESMRSFNSFDYAYNNKSAIKKNEETITVSFKNDIKKLDESKVNSKAEDISVKKEVIDKSKEEAKAIVQVATETNQLYKDATPVLSNVIKIDNEKPVLKQAKIKNLVGSDIWYAQPIENGYQLVDKTPKVVMKLLKSSTDTIFIAQSEAKNGMVYQKDAKWIFEYYENGELIQEELNLKF